MLLQAFSVNFAIQFSIDMPVDKDVLENDRILLEQHYDFSAKDWFSLII